MAKLLFGVHLHQPVDNFDWVIDHALDVCYRPFFEVMSRYRDFKFSVHCSGWLLEQIKLKDKNLYKTIQSMAKDNTIEIFSAGYYEPILTTIPPQDRVSQIEMLNSTINKEFSQTPTGSWLTERVWEPSLISDFDATGIKYSVMDDYHFISGGFDEELLDGYYMSEDSGKNIALFPISKKLRYAVPFMSVEKAIEAIKSFNQADDSAAIIFDDAEKFGMWPGTHDWVYKKQWLEKFVEAVIADDEIETMHYKSYYEGYKTRGIAYVPNTSYYEMGEWSLRAKDTKALIEMKNSLDSDFYDSVGVKFLKGGIWKNFLVKYRESNRIHKRMLELSNARESVSSKKYDDALYRLQTNDPLWHGVFGGLYLPNLRDTAYKYMIECEKIRYKSKSAIAVDDNELDGYDKIKMVSPSMLVRFDRAQMVEFDMFDKNFNYQNTLTRYSESYHASIINPPKIEHTSDSSDDGIDTIHNAALEVSDELKEALIYDWYTKNSFVDHISDSSFSAVNFRASNFRDYGDFTLEPFESTIDGDRAIFSRDGGFYFPSHTKASMKKEFRLDKNRLYFDISIDSEHNYPLTYVLEYNFHFSDSDEVMINSAMIDDMGEVESNNSFEITDRYLAKKITINFDKPCKLYYFKLKTISQSEKGYDLTTQGISFAFVYEFSGDMTLSGHMEISDE